MFRPNFIHILTNILNTESLQGHESPLSNSRHFWKKNWKMNNGRWRVKTRKLQGYSQRKDETLDLIVRNLYSPFSYIHDS